MSDSFDQGVMRGIGRYARIDRNWRLHGYGWMFSPLGSLQQWQGDGVIVRLQYLEDLSFVRNLNCPIVDIAEAFPTREISTVRNDDVETGRIAAAHFREKGFSSFAFCGISDVRWAHHRLEGFLSGIEVASVPVFERPLRWWLQHSYSPDLAVFIKTLPKTVAIFGCNDKVALRISNVCDITNVHIPEEVALLGVDNEEILCELANPSLSSIELAADRIGWEAAQLLDHLMNCDNAFPNLNRTVSPVAVVQRGSTETYATQDQLVRNALQCINGTDGHSMTVQAVVKRLAVSRRVLEKRFKQATGQTIHDRIVLQRIRRAQNLLETSDQKVDTIAAEVGFGSSQRFFVQFRRHTGMTPNEFRSRRRRTQNL